MPSENLSKNLNVNMQNPPDGISESQLEANQVETQLQHRDRSSI